MKWKLKIVPVLRAWDLMECAPKSTFKLKDSYCFPGLRLFLEASPFTHLLWRFYVTRQLLCCNSGAVAMRNKHAVSNSQQGFSWSLQNTLHDPTSKQPHYHFFPRPACPVIAYCWIWPSCNWVVFARRSKTCENKTEAHTAAGLETT